MRFHPHCFAISGSNALAFPNRDERCVAVGVNVEAIVSRLHNGERGVGCIHFVSFAMEQARNLEVQRALSDFKLYRAVVEIGESEAGLAVHAHDSTAKM